jgi:hypothetical protein
MGVLTMHLTQPPPVIPPEVFDSIGAPRAIAGVIEQALAKDRNQRFSSIDELARAVRRASGDKLTGPVVAQASVPGPSTSPGRIKTEWTGNLSIPELAPSAPSRRSKLPILMGAIACAAGAAAYLAIRGGAPSSDGGSSGPGSAPGSRDVTSASPISQPPIHAPIDPLAGAAPLAFKRAHVHLLSAPQDAEIKDLSTGVILGHTPLRFELSPSRQARQFAVSRKGYRDAVVELVPDQEDIQYTEKLVRGPAGRPILHQVDDRSAPAERTGSASGPPESAPAPAERTGSASGPPESAPAPAELAKPEPGAPAPSRPGSASPGAPGDDGIDPILKPDPSRAGSGVGSAP